MKKEKGHYVITEDIMTMSRFGNYVIEKSFARYVSQQILGHCQKLITPEVIMLYEEQMTEWVSEIHKPEMIVQTLAYSGNLENPKFLQVTRAVNSDLVNLDEQVPRKGSAPINQQLLDFAGIKNAVILDDVIYSGNSSVEIIQLAKSVGCEISKVLACVTIREGRELLESKGIEVKSQFHFDNVIDEVCERDFIPGFPCSGRTLIGKNGQCFTVPYLLPWGNPMNWASVPRENLAKFSKACIQTGIEFWEEVSPRIGFFEVPAVVFDPKISTNIRFVDYLHQCKNLLS